MRMIVLPDMLTNYPRPDLIKWVTDTCVVLGARKFTQHHAVFAWCDSRFGEQRAGNILHEAQDGWIDYFDGDWQIAFNPFVFHEELVVWFASHELMAEYLITWC